MGGTSVVLGSFGLGLLLLGSALRFWPNWSQTGLQEGAIVALVCGAAWVATWWVRPRSLGAPVWGAYVLLAGVAFAAAAAVAVSPQSLGLTGLPRSLELVGGALWLSATAQRQLRRLESRRVKRFKLPRKAKLRRVDVQGGVTPVVAHQIAVDDRIRVLEGDLLPVDGFLESGSVQVDARRVHPGPSPRTVEADEIVFAGSSVVSGEGTLRVTHRPDEAWVTNRAAWVKAETPKVLRGGPRLAVLGWSGVLVALALAGAGLWLRGTMASWAEIYGAGAALLACVPAHVILVFLRARSETLQSGLDAGVWYGSAEAVIGMPSVGRWMLDPELAAAPGPVEALAFTAVDGQQLVRWAAAVAEPWPSPEAASVLAARGSQAEARAAATKQEGALMFATVDGHRLVLGPEAAMRDAAGFELQEDQRTAIDFLQERGMQVWLLASQSEGILGAIGATVAADPTARACAEELHASLLPVLPEASSSRLAAAMGIEAKARNARTSDGVLLATGTEAPPKGRLFRVTSRREVVAVDPKADASLFVEALKDFPAFTHRVQAIHGNARLRSVWLYALVVASTAGLVAVGFAEPAFAALLGRLGLTLGYAPLGADRS